MCKGRPPCQLAKLSTVTCHCIMPRWTASRTLTHDNARRGQLRGVAARGAHHHGDLEPQCGGRGVGVGEHKRLGSRAISVRSCVVATHLAAHLHIWVGQGAQCWGGMLARYAGQWSREGPRGQGKAAGLCQRTL